MPQLDAATYRSQVFWLTVFFGAYYAIAVSFLVDKALPPRATGRD